jgi:hypothetical protein
MLLNMKRSFLLFLLLCVAVVASAQDRVHLKEAQQLKVNGTTYEAKAGEGFRLRAIDKRNLTIELYDSLLVKVRREDVVESDAPLLILQNAPMFLTGDDAYHPQAHKEAIIAGAEVKKGERLAVLGHERGVYLVKNAQGIEGWINRDVVMPMLNNVISGNRQKVPVTEGTKTETIPPGGKMIPLERSGDKWRVRTADGFDGWTDRYIITENDLRGGLYKLLWNLCNWSNKGFLAWVLVALIYGLGLVVWAAAPGILVYWLVVKIKYIPNFICKVLLAGILLIFYFLSGMSILALPPMDSSTGWTIAIGLICLGMGFTTISTYWNTITAERCPYWKCHAVGDYTITDMTTREWDEITTTTTTYSDGHKNTSSNTEHKVAATYYKRCNVCGTEWTSGS